MVRLALLCKRKSGYSSGIWGERVGGLVSGLGIGVLGWGDGCFRLRDMKVGDQRVGF